MEIWHYALIGAGIFLILIIVARRYISAVFKDFLDTGLGFLDEAFGGIAGFDWGDWIAGLVVFTTEGKTLKPWARILVTWEVVNFWPIGWFIPIEIVTNFIPSTTIARFLASYYGQADDAFRKLEKDVELGKHLNIDVDQDKKTLSEVHKLLKAENPVEALKKAKKADHQIGEKLFKYVDSLIVQAQQMINGVLTEKPEGPDEVIQMLQAGIQEAQGYMAQAQQLREAENPDLYGAVQAATRARDTMQAAFNNCKAFLQSA